MPSLGRAGEDGTGGGQGKGTPSLAGSKQQRVAPMPPPLRLEGWGPACQCSNHPPSWWWPPTSQGHQSKVVALWLVVRWADKCLGGGSCAWRVQPSRGWMRCAAAAVAAAVAAAAAGSTVGLQLSNVDRERSLYCACMVGERGVGICRVTPKVAVHPPTRRILPLRPWLGPGQRRCTGSLLHRSGSAAPPARTHPRSGPKSARSPAR
jgi:hypothetical protein